MLVSILGFIRYAVSTPGVQTLGYVWGLTNGWFLFAIIIGQTPKGAPVEGGLPYVGLMARNVTWEIMSLGGATGPDWFTPDMVRNVWVGLVAGAVYLYLVVLWGLPLPGHTWVRSNLSNAKGGGPRRVGGAGGPAAMPATGRPAAGGRRRPAARGAVPNTAIPYEEVG